MWALLKDLLTGAPEMTILPLVLKHPARHRHRHRRRPVLLIQMPLPGTRQAKAAPEENLIKDERLIKNERLTGVKIVAHSETIS